MRTRLNSKGRMNIPKKILQILGLGPGSQVEFDVDAQGRIFIRKSERSASKHPLAKDRFERVRECPAKGVHSRRLRHLAGGRDQAGETF